MGLVRDEYHSVDYHLYTVTVYVGQIQNLEIKLPTFSICLFYYRGSRNILQLSY